MRSILQDIRVLELAQIMAGPTCGMMLADMGADVAKVEKIPGGDDTRAFTGGSTSALAGPFVMLNRNKRGLALDLKRPEGQALLRRMAERADVVIENYRIGTMEKLGLGYEQLSARNPGLVYCSITGFGPTGPWARRGGFDLMAQGFSGIMSVTGEPGGPPLKSGNSVADINAGVLASFGIMAALFHRERTGRGQVVETSLLDAALQQMYWFAAMYFQSGKAYGASGSGHPLTAPYQAFQTADGWITLGGANQPNWERIAAAVGHPEWSQDPRFLTGALRKANERELTELLSAEFVRENADHWIALFEREKIPVGPIHDIAQALEHPQTLSSERVITVDHPVAGRSKALGMPVRFSETPARVTRPAPMLGEHSRGVLRDYGVSDSEIDRLVETAVVRELAVESPFTQQTSETST
jgi:crotonobetainyl-CoA:carnitine CoA-transferase CaiB-like acyl-CoA transferase